MTGKYKALSDFRIKNAARGEVSAVIATMSVIDRDGDVVLPGAIDSGAAVVISSWQHTSWDGGLPVGSGTIREKGTEIIFDGRFLVDTSHGHDAFATVKALSEAGLQEWSFSLADIKSRRGEFQGQKVNFLERFRVREVSPVMEGASIGTRTLVAKSRADVAHRAELQRIHERLVLGEARSRLQR